MVKHIIHKCTHIGRRRRHAAIIFFFFLFDLWMKLTRSAMFGSISVSFSNRPTERSASHSSGCLGSVETVPFLLNTTFSCDSSSLLEMKKKQNFRIHVHFAWSNGLFDGEIWLLTWVWMLMNLFEKYNNRNNNSCEKQNEIVIKWHEEKWKCSYEFFHFHSHGNKNLMRMRLFSLNERKVKMMIIKWV